MARSATKRKTPAKKAAPRKAPRKQPVKPKGLTLKDMVEADVKRAGLRMSMLFYALNSIVISAAMGAGLVWFTVTSYQDQDSRVARLAQSIVRYRADSTPRIMVLERDLDRLTRHATSEWSRSHMLRWCIEAQKLNRGFKCPSPVKIAPDNRPSGSDRPAIAADKLNKTS